MHDFFERQTKMKKFLPYMAIIGAMLIWSVSGIAIKMALVNFTSLTLLVMRFSLAILLLLIIGLVCQKNSLLGLQKVKWKDLHLFLLAGFFQPCLYYLLETYTYDALRSPTIAEALLSTSPVLSPLFAMALLKEKVTRNNVVGIIVSTIGMLMLVLVGSEKFSIGNKWGILTAFLSVVTAILYSVVLKKIPAGYNSLTIVFYVQICALFLFYPLWIVREGIHTPFPTDINLWTDNLWRSLAGVGYLGVCSTVVAFILFCYSVRQIGVTQANVFNNVRPIFTAVAMMLIYGEQLPFGKIVGVVLVIIGLFVCQKVSKNEKIAR